MGTCVSECTSSRLGVVPNGSVRRLAVPWYSPDASVHDPRNAWGETWKEDAVSGFNWLSICLVSLWLDVLLVELGLVCVALAGCLSTPVARRLSGGYVPFAS